MSIADDTGICGIMDVVCGNDGCSSSKAVIVDASEVSANVADDDNSRAALWICPLVCAARIVLLLVVFMSLLIVVVFPLRAHVVMAVILLLWVSIHIQWRSR